MKVINKQWFAIIILILAIGSSIAIGYSRHESRKVNNDRVFQDANLDTNKILPFISVEDNEKMLSEDTEEKIQIYNANWNSNKQSAVWLVTFDKADDSLEKFAESQVNKLGMSEKDAVIILLKNSDNFVFYACEAFPYSFNAKRAQEITNLINSAYESDLDAGILRVYNKLNEYYNSEDVVFEEGEDSSEEGAFDDFFNDPSYDTFKESIDKIVDSAKDTNTNQKIRCFSKNSNFVVEEETSSNDSTSVSTESNNKKGIKLSKWKIIVLVIVVLGILGGKKKTSYK